MFGEDRFTGRLAGPLTLTFVLAITVAIVLGATGGTAAADTDEDTIEYEFTITTDGEPKTVGLPGPVDGTYADLFSDGTEGVGAIYRYDGGWVRVHDLSANPQPMDALLLVTHGDADRETVPLTVPIATDTPADDPNHTLDRGWNFVPAPTYDSVEGAFGADDTLIVLDRFDRVESDYLPWTGGFNRHIPGSTAWGEPASAVDPFDGYFVYSEDTTTLESTLTGVQNQSEADDKLRIDDPPLPVLEFAGDGLIVPPNETVTPTATITHEGGLHRVVNGTAALSVDNESVATVEENSVRGVADGTTTLTMVAEKLSTEITVSVIDSFSLYVQGGHLEYKDGEPLRLPIPACDGSEPAAERVELEYGHIEDICMAIHVDSIKPGGTFTLPADDTDPDTNRFEMPWISAGNPGEYGTADMLGYDHTGYYFWSEFWNTDTAPGHFNPETGALEVSPTFLHWYHIHHVWYMIWIEYTCSMTIDDMTLTTGVSGDLHGEAITGAIENGTASGQLVANDFTVPEIVTEETFGGDCDEEFGEDHPWEAGESELVLDVVLKIGAGESQGQGTWDDSIDENGAQGPVTYGEYDKD